MGDRDEDPETPRTTRLRPRTLGQSIPIPPLVPTVVIASLVLGLVLGFGLASRPGPSAVPSDSGLASAAQPSPPGLADGSVPSATPFELPPAGGLTLDQALAALKLADVGTGSPTDVISARIARFGDVARGALPDDRWVWAFVVRGVFYPASCGGLQPSPELCPPSAATELAIFDFRTGEFLEDRLPAYP